MKQINYKKLIIPNIPYVFFVYLFDKVGQAVRLAPGADISAKILKITDVYKRQGISGAKIYLNVDLPHPCHHANQQKTAQDHPHQRPVTLVRCV